MSAIHFCIDVQKVYPHIYGSSIGYWDALKGNISLLVSELDKRNIPTVYMAYGEANGPFVPFKNGVGFLENTPRRTRETLNSNPLLNIDFRLQPKSLVAFKTDCSAYKEPSIAGYVKDRGFSKIILSGVFEGSEIDWENKCVSKTASDFSKAGYEVVIAAEATQRGVGGGNSSFLPLEVRKRVHARWGVRVDPTEDIMATLAANPLDDLKKTAPTLPPWRAAIAGLTKVFAFGS